MGQESRQNDVTTNDMRVRDILLAVLVPVFGMAGARVVLHEKLTLASLLAAALVLLGLVMVVAGGRRPGLGAVRKTE
jgi:drug/metabolite transporter (DMT)-like permease